MMKDFAKSVKQTGFPQRIETPLTQDECDHLSEEFIRMRGGLYTGGIVCKAVRRAEEIRHANR